MDCEYCDGEGYVPCEECNDIPIQVVAKPIETPLEVHKKEVRYWEMVKQEIEVFNQTIVEPKNCRLFRCWVDLQKRKLL